MAADDREERRGRPPAPQAAGAARSRAPGVELQLHDARAGHDEHSAVAEREYLRQALAGLPSEQRRALLLASFFGRTAAEVAELEAIPLGTAKTRIRTGMNRLRERMEVADE